MIKKGLKYKQLSRRLISSIDTQDAELLRAIESLLEDYKNSKIGMQVPKVPLSLFSNRKLGILETLVIILKDHFKLNYSKIAEILNRDDRTIWTAYNKAKAKNGDDLSFSGEGPIVPCDIFSDRKLGPLEALTIYCRERLNLSFNEISTLLKRNYGTIWLSYQNGVKKRGNQNHQEEENQSI